MLALAATTDPRRVAAARPRLSVQPSPDPRLPEGRPRVAVDAEPLPAAALEQNDAAWGETPRGLMVATPSTPPALLSVAGDRRLHRVPARGRRAAGRRDLLGTDLRRGISRALGDPVLNAADDVFVVNSFSKYFGMTGWRLGWLVAPAGLRARAGEARPALLHFAIDAGAASPRSPPSPATIAILEERRHEFAQRRDVDMLPRAFALGFRHRHRAAGRVLRVCGRVGAGRRLGNARAG